MSKKIPLTLAAASAMLAIPFLGLTSCDSGPLDTGGASTFDLGTRFDRATLEADLNATVEMPQFFLTGDSFTHDVVFGFPDFVDGGGFIEEYGIGFQTGDEPIVVDTAGQISNAEGDSVTDNINYIYDPDSASFTLSEQNSFPANLGTEARRAYFESRMEDIENVPFANIGSLAEAIAGNFTSEEAARIYEVAIESIGMIASDQGEVGTFGSGLGQIQTGASVRIGRTIRYEPTSTNSDLLATGVITGNVTITDIYVSVRILLPHDGRGRVLALAPTSVRSINGVIVDYDGIDALSGVYTGTFTLNLNGYTF